MNYPLEPLIQAARMSDDQTRRLLRASGASWERYRVEGLHPITADRFATRLGRHPVELWPDWVEVEFDDIEKTTTPKLAQTDVPTHWTIAFTCPECGRNVVPVNIGRPTDGQRRVTAVFKCDGVRPHESQMVVLVGAA